MRRLWPVTGLRDFSSNDYLGLSRSAWIAYQTALSVEQHHHLPQSATASRLLNGNTLLMEYLEQEVAGFHRADTGLIFNSGYDANLALAGTLPRPGDDLYLDERCHASIHQGAKLSGAQVHLFSHNDAGALAGMLQQSGPVKWVFTESLFSMDGDRAPLKELAEVCKKFSAELIVDEAHATGVFGPQGRGLCAEAGVEWSCFARLYTFGKAIGAHGAIVVGSKRLRDYLVNFAKPLIYSTALPLHTLLRVRSAYRFLQMSSLQQRRLIALMAYFRDKSPQLPFDVVGDGPVFGVIIPGNERVKNVALRLQEEGFDVRPILAPTVPKGAERIRISLHAFNTAAEIDELAAILATLS